MNQPALPRLPVPPGRAGVIVVAQALRELLAGHGPGFRVGPTGSDPAGVPAPGARRPVGDAVVPPVVVIPTSGSTGTARDVVLPLSALVASADLGAAALGPPGRWMTAVPVTGVGGMLTVVRALRAGDEPWAWPGLAGAGTFTPASFVAAAEPELDRAERLGAPAYLSLVPTQLHRLTADSRAVAVAARFAAILVGGSPLAPRIREEAEQRGVHVVTTYGATETGGGVVYDGIPLPGVSVEIVDGLVRVGGPTIATGYLDGPDESFLGGVFHTEDLAEWSDGRLVVLGRADDVVKVGGTKVSLAAVTRVVRTDPGVMDAVAMAQESDEWGQVVHVDVVPSGSAQPGLLDALGDLVEAALGRHHRPHTMAVVPEIPVTAAGKPPISRNR